MTERAWMRRVLPPFIALFVGSGLLAFYLGRFAPARIALSRLVQPVASALLVLLAILAIGWLALRVSSHVLTRFGRLTGDAAEAGDPVAALLVGMPLYGTLLGAIAWTGTGVEPATMLATLMLGGVGLMAARRMRLGPLTLGGLDVVLLLPPVLLAFLEATTPVASPDELVYKLAVPRAYVLYGGMIDLPLNSHSYLTMAQGLAHFGALVLSGGIAAKLVSFAVYLGALAALRSLGDRVAPGSGVWVAAVFAWTPALAIIAGWCWSEWALLGLLALSWEAWERFGDHRDAGSAALLVVALGGAAAIKYTALPWILCFTILAFLRLRSGPARPASPLRLTAVSLVIFAACAGLFYVRNLVWTGSPVAPFLEPDPPAIVHFDTAHGEGGIHRLIHGDDIVNERLLDDALGVVLPLCVLLSPLSLLGVGVPRRWPLFALGAVQLLLFASLETMSRLIVIALLPLTVLGAGVVAGLARASGPVLRGVLALFVTIALSGQMLLVGFVFVTGYEFMGYAVGNEDVAANLARTRAFAAIYDWIDRNTPQESVILLIGENRTYHLSRRSLSAGNLDGRRLAAWLGRFASEDALAAEFARLGVTHVLLHPDWIVPGQAPMNLDPVAQTFMVEIPAETWNTLTQLLDHRGQSVYRDAKYTLFELKPQR